MRAKHIICMLKFEGSKIFRQNSRPFLKKKEFFQNNAIFFLLNAKVHIILKSRNEGAKSTSIGARTGFLGSSHFLLRKENSSFTRKTTFGVLPKTIIFSSISSTFLFLNYKTIKSFIHKFHKRFM